LYELINKQVGFQRNLNLFENLFFVKEFYNRMKAKRGNSVAAVKNGLELRSAIAALYTATTSYNRSSNVADLFDSSKIPLTYSGSTPADYSVEAKSALTGNSGSSDVYAATKKEMMIFANYITTSKGPDFSSVSSVLTPDQLICAWFNPDTLPQNCSKVYTLNSAGHVTLGGTEVSVAEANAVFTKFFMPMNSRLTDEEKLSLFRTFYLALKYAGTIFYNGSDVEELNGALLKTAYLVFDGIDGNANAVTITDTFDASAHTVAVLDGAEMATRPYMQKLSSLTDQISLKVAAASADVEKVLINIEGKEFEKVQENTRTYYTPKGNLKEKSIVLTPGTLTQGEKALKELLGFENVDLLGNITGKMTIVANSKISGKTYTTQKSYDFFVNNDSDGVNSKPVPANIQIFVNDSTGNAIPANANPTIILNPGNKVYYPTNGVVSIENLTPAAYTVDAFADGYYAKNVSVNVPAGATFGVEIRLDEELTSTADANLELKVNINTAKHPSKVYIQ
ncbi:carboxypeptidase regulatory-like domain-containing protein, partial [bacterium]|nr:carboxypeptidase regulatory-like domain-containing protein [bacterium]